jgi:23S rRNA (pseudouridine1915-N3)-methyltransferase
VKIQIRAVGRMRDRRMEELCQEYLVRAGRHLPVEILEVDQAEALLRNLPPGAEVIALDPGGESWSSRNFADHIERSMTGGRKAVVFLIGGPDGLPASLLQNSPRRLSLSSLTLPHRLARVVLCEQVYRALSRIRGEPYDR